MKDRERLVKLKALADLLRDRDLAALSRAQDAKAQTEALLRALDHSVALPAPATIAAAQVVERYGLWATNRRVALNQQHARDTAAWLTNQKAAQSAFGRAEVMGKLLMRK